MPISQESKIVIMAEIDRLNRQKQQAEKKLSIIDREKKKIDREVTSITSDIEKLQKDFDQG